MKNAVHFLKKPDRMFFWYIKRYADNVINYLKIQITSPNQKKEPFYNSLKQIYIFNYSPVSYRLTNNSECNSTAVESLTFKQFTRKTKKYEILINESSRFKNK